MCECLSLVVTQLALTFGAMHLRESYAKDPSLPMYWVFVIATIAVFTFPTFAKLWGKTISPMVTLVWLVSSLVILCSHVSTDTPITVATDTVIGTFTAYGVSALINLLSKKVAEINATIERRGKKREQIEAYIKCLEGS
jgi:hypothetical protein